MPDQTVRTLEQQIAELNEVLSQSRSSFRFTAEAADLFKAQLGKNLQEIQDQRRAVAGNTEENLAFQRSLQQIDSAYKANFTTYEKGLSYLREFQITNNDLLNNNNDLGKSFNNLGQHVSIFTNKLAEGLADSSQYLRSFSEMYTKYVDSITGSKIFDDALLGNYVNYSTTLDTLARSTINYGKSADSINYSIEKLGEVTNLSKKDLLELYNTIEKGYVGIRDYSAIDGLIERVSKLTNNAQQAKDMVQSTMTVMQKFGTTSVFGLTSKQMMELPTETLYNALMVQVGKPENFRSKYGDIIAEKQKAQAKAEGIKLDAGEKIGDVVNSVGTGGMVAGNSILQGTALAASALAASKLIAGTKQITTNLNNLTATLSPATAATAEAATAAAARDAVSGALPSPTGTTMGSGRTETSGSSPTGNPLTGGIGRGGGSGGSEGPIIRNAVTENASVGKASGFSRFNARMPAGLTAVASIAPIAINAIIQSGKYSEETKNLSTNMSTYATSGAMLGGMLGGPLGAILGLTGGAALGYFTGTRQSEDSKKQKEIEEKTNQILQKRNELIQEVSRGSAGTLKTNQDIKNAVEEYNAGVGEYGTKLNATTLIFTAHVQKLQEINIAQQQINSYLNERITLESNLLNISRNETFNSNDSIESAKEIVKQKLKEIEVTQEANNQKIKMVQELKEVYTNLEKEKESINNNLDLTFEERAQQLKEKNLILQQKEAEADKLGVNLQNIEYGNLMLDIQQKIYDAEKAQTDVSIAGIKTRQEKINLDTSLAESTERLGNAMHMGYGAEVGLMMQTMNQYKRGIKESMGMIESLMARQAELTQQLNAGGLDEQTRKGKTQALEEVNTRIEKEQINLQNQKIKGLEKMNTLRDRYVKALPEAGFAGFTFDFDISQDKGLALFAGKGPNSPLVGGTSGGGAASPMAGFSTAGGFGGAGMISNPGAFGPAISKPSFYKAGGQIPFVDEGFLAGSEHQQFPMYVKSGSYMLTKKEVDEGAVGNNLLKKDYVPIIGHGGEFLVSPEKSNEIGNAKSKKTGGFIPFPKNAPKFEGGGLTLAPPVEKDWGEQAMSTLMAGYSLIPAFSTGDALEGIHSTINFLGGAVGAIGGLVVGAPATPVGMAATGTLGYIGGAATTDVVQHSIASIIPAIASNLPIIWEIAKIYSAKDTEKDNKDAKKKWSNAYYHTSYDVPKTIEREERLKTGADRGTLNAKNTQASEDSAAAKAALSLAAAKLARREEAANDKMRNLYVYNSDPRFRIRIDNIHRRETNGPGSGEYCVTLEEKEALIKEIEETQKRIQPNTESKSKTKQTVSQKNQAESQTGNDSYLNRIKAQKEAWVEARRIEQEIYKTWTDYNHNSLGNVPNQAIKNLALYAENFKKTHPEIIWDIPSEMTALSLKTWDSPNSPIRSEIDNKVEFHINQRKDKAIRDILQLELDAGYGPSEAQDLQEVKQIKENIDSIELKKLKPNIIKLPASIQEDVYVRIAEINKKQAKANKAKPIRGAEYQAEKKYRQILKDNKKNTTGGGLTARQLLNTALHPYTTVNPGPPITIYLEELEIDPKLYPAGPIPEDKFNDYISRATRWGTHPVINKTETAQVTKPETVQVTKSETLSTDLVQQPKSEKDEELVFIEQIKTQLSHGDTVAGGQIGIADMQRYLKSVPALTYDKLKTPQTPQAPQTHNFYEKIPQNAKGGLTKIGESNLMDGGIISVLHPNEVVLNQGQVMKLGLTSKDFKNIGVPGFESGGHTFGSTSSSGGSGGGGAGVMTKLLCGQCQASLIENAVTTGVSSMVGGSMSPNTQYSSMSNGLL